MLRRRAAEITAKRPGVDPSDGRLTNTHAFLVGPFTRWAIFVYGQDMHVPHHLFPGIPHDRLPRLRGLL